jgi:hypothetical protein
MLYLKYHDMRYNMLMESAGENNQDQDLFRPIVPIESPLPENVGMLEEEGISWTASEFIQHSKDASWYLIALLVIALLAGLGYLLSHDVFTPGAVVIFGVILLLVSNRKPRTLSYLVDSHGIMINNREYPFTDFQSFSIIKEGSIESVMLLPLKRWSPVLNLYFSPDDGQKIFDTIGSFLPFEQREKDLIDKFLHKIRF